MSKDELEPVQFHKIIQTKAYTAIILSGKHKSFAIYTDPSIGKTLQLYLSKTPVQRPLTHDLIRLICDGFDIKVKQVIISKIEGTTFFAKLFLEQKANEITRIVESDARPSDCLTLALMHNIPVYCTKQVLSTVIQYKE